MNDGSITLFETDSSGAPMTYTLHSGPVSRPPQTSNVFSSLPPGMYFFYITDANGSWAGVEFTVYSTYSIPDFHPYVVNPICLRTSQYLLIAGLDSGTGLAPMTWQLIAPSPQTSAPQSSDTFHVTMPGTYTIQCTDACGDIQTRTFTFAAQRGSNMDTTNLYPSSYFMGCDSAFITVDYPLHSDSNAAVFPLTLSVTNISTGAHSQYIIDSLWVDADTFSHTSEYYSNYDNNWGGEFVNMGIAIPHTIAGNVYTVLIADGCGDSAYYIETVPAKALLPGGFSSLPGPVCGYINETSYSYNMPSPNSWVFIDNTTHMVVDSGRDSSSLGATQGMVLVGYTPGHQYTLEAMDLCGDTLRSTFIWPQPVIPPLNFNVQINSPNVSSCLDSTAGASIIISGYGVGILTILSGPATAQSSTPGYAYHDSLRYPHVYGVSGYGFPIEIADLPVGTYIFRFTDSCGDNFTDSFAIAQADLRTFDRHVGYQRGCIDANKIFFSVTGTQNPYVSVYNVNTQQNYFGNNISSSVVDTAYNIPSGTYVVYTDFQSSWYNLEDTLICARTFDTITIPPYENPELLGFSLTSCSPTVYLHCLADSSTGVMPFTYSIVSGPQTFAAQQSSVFTLSGPGTYSVRLTDICGNSSVKDITIDSVPGPAHRYSHTDSCYQVHIGGRVYLNDTTLSDTIRNILGCDSLILIDSIIIKGNLAGFDIFPQGVVDTFCRNRAPVLSPDAVFSSYVWNDGSTARTHSVASSGGYSLTVTDSSGCAASAAIMVALLDSPYISSGWPGDTAVCDLAPLHIDLALNTTVANYSWGNTDASQYSLQRTIANSGLYTFSVSNYCGTSTYTMTVAAIYCTADIYVPNAFTPNGDGVNDVFQVFTSFDVVHFDLRIFDRWGEKVFDSNDIGTGWDGSYRHEAMPAGIYTYITEMNTLIGTPVHRQGSITLIR